MQKVLSLPSVFKNFGKTQGSNRSAKEVSIARARTFTKSSHIAKAADDKATMVVSALLIALNTMLFVWYFVDVNTAATTGYEMRTLQTRMENLTDENKKISLKIAEQSSIISFQNDTAHSLFVPITGAVYLQNTTQLTQK